MAPAMTRLIGRMPASSPRRARFAGPTKTASHSLPPPTPFSFRYGGAASATFLKDWPRTVADERNSDAHQSGGELDRPQDEVARGRHRHCVQALPGRRVGAGIREPRHARHAAALGGAGPRCSTAHRLLSQAGPGAPTDMATSAASARFCHSRPRLSRARAVVLAPEGGRPSNGAFPFFNAQYGDQGMIAAIGWSGQWRAALSAPTPGQPPCARAWRSSPWSCIRARRSARRAFSSCRGRGTGWWRTIASDA